MYYLKCIQKYPERPLRYIHHLSYFYQHVRPSILANFAVRIKLYKACH